MAVKHAVIKPVRHAGVASQDYLYLSAGAIVEGAPVVFSSGKVAEFTDTAAGPVAGSGIIGIALNATTAANQDVLVALAYPGRAYKGSLGTNTANGGSDDGATALTLAMVGSIREMHKDATTLKWLVGTAAAVQLPVADASAVGSVVVHQLIDKVGATTNDTPSFGSVGRGVGAITPTPPNATFDQDPPAGPNFGLALVEFCFPIRTTIFGLS